MWEASIFGSHSSSRVTCSRSALSVIVMTDSLRWLLEFEASRGPAAPRQRACHLAPRTCPEGRGSPRGHGFLYALRLTRGAVVDADDPLAVHHVDRDRGAVRKLPADQRPADAGLHVVLDQAS